MEHQITLEKIEKQTLTFPVVSASEGNEIKDLRLVLRDGVTSWIVRHFTDGKVDKASWQLNYLSRAIEIYNQF